MTKDGKRLFTLEPEDMFGELALLYNCTHTYSVSGIQGLELMFACRQAIHRDLVGTQLILV